MDKLLKYNGVQEALKFLREDDERTLQEHLEMCQIPAPSYEEGEKAEYVRKKMVDAGLSEVHVDEVGNVLGTWKGTGNGPRIMVAGHTDTVFPRETDLTLKKEGERYSCPGIGDDTRAVAELLSLARAMKATGIRGEGDIVFCANVCEEGLGDLRGIKHVFKDMANTEEHYDGFVSIDDKKNLRNHLPGSRQRALSGNFPRNRWPQLHRLRNSQPDSRNGKGYCENQRSPDTKESENYFQCRRSKRRHVCKCNCGRVFYAGGYALCGCRGT